MSVFMPSLCQFLRKGLFKIAPLPWVWPPSLSNNAKKLQKWYHGASLMATVKWSQVKSWPNISDEARFSLSALSITLEAHYSSSLPLLPLMLLSLYLILFLSMDLPPSELRRSSFFLTSGKECTLYQLYFLYSASHNLKWTKYKINLWQHSFAPFYFLLKDSLPKDRWFRKTILSCMHHYVTVNAFFRVLQIRN